MVTEKSRKVIFVNTNEKVDKVSLPVPYEKLCEMDAGDTNSFIKRLHVTFMQCILHLMKVSAWLSLPLIMTQYTVPKTPNGKHLLMKKK